MKPPLGASHGPQDNNAGSQAHSPLYVFMGLAFPLLLRQTQAIKQNNLWPSLVLTLGLLKCHCSKNVETSWMEACLYLWRHELISLFWITLEYFAQKIWLFCSKLLHRMDPVQHAWVFLSIYFVVWPQIFLWHELFLLFLSSWCSTDLADSVWFVWVVWLNSVFTGGACLVFIGQFMSDFFFLLLLPKSFVFCSSSC